jgi:hypothetical protein
MTKKIEHVFRDQRLPAEEVAKDAEVRRKVQAEFPPAPITLRNPQCGECD